MFTCPAITVATVIGFEVCKNNRVHNSAPGLVSTLQDIVCMLRLLKPTISCYGEVNYLLRIVQISGFPLFWFVICDLCCSRSPAFIESHKRSDCVGTCETFDGNMHSTKAVHRCSGATGALIMMAIATTSVSVSALENDMDRTPPMVRHALATRSL